MGAENVIALEAEAQGERLQVRAGMEHDAATLPLGPGGAHLAAGFGGTLRAHFRGAAASFARPGAAGSRSAGAAGRVVQSGYLGAGWRYGLEVGRSRYLVDDPQRLEVGDAVWWTCRRRRCICSRPTLAAPATYQ